LEDLVKAYPSYVDILAKVTLQVWTGLLPGGAGGPGESLSLIYGYLGQGNSLQVWADLLRYLEGLEDLVKAYPSYVDILAKVTLSKSGQTVPGGAEGPSESLSLVSGYLGQDRL
jgi:hypothetical protein